MRSHILGADTAHPVDAVFVNSPLKDYGDQPRRNDFTLPVLGLGSVARRPGLVFSATWFYPLPRQDPHAAG